MSTEVVYPQTTALATVTAPRRLVEWAQEAGAAHDLALVMCQTSFCPEAFRDKPGEATAAILAGSEVGLSPIASLNAYDVINGRPAPKAIALRALVQSAGHEIWLESATDDRVVMKGTRRGSTQVQESVWTMKRARDAKLTGKANWQTQPQNMLTARATSEIARLVGSDVILGIPYSSEELADLEPEPTAIVSRSGTSRVRRLTVAHTVNESEVEPEPVEVVEEPTKQVEASAPTESTIEPEVVEADENATVARQVDFEMIRPAQVKMLAVLMNKAGLTIRANALAYCNNVIGREIESRNELTMREASRVIDALAIDTEDAEPPLDGDES